MEWYIRLDMNGYKNIVKFEGFHFRQRLILINTAKFVVNHPGFLIVGLPQYIGLEQRDF